MKARRTTKEAGIEPAGAMLKGLAERLHYWREHQGMTQAGLALRSGMSMSYVSVLENGARSPSYETLLTLSKALEIPVSELVRAEDEDAVDDGYYRRLVDFAQGARLSRKQVENLISVGRLMFGGRGN